MTHDLADSHDSSSLPPLPLAEWEPEKITLHMYAQIVGKIRLGIMPHRNHWWHVPLYVTSLGWTTGPMPWKDLRFEIAFDFVNHELIVTTTDGDRRTIALEGQSVAEFHEDLFGTLAGLGIHPRILAVPYDQPFKTPFAEDHEHRGYNREFTHRLARIHAWSSVIFWEFSGRFIGKTSPIHLFWHSFDLAVTRFSGRPAPPMESANSVAREAYSHEVVSFGFWAGDANVREPAYYAYAAPEPKGLREQPLEPAGAHWVEQNGGSLAVLPYALIQRSNTAEQDLLAFLESSYLAGAKLAGWDVAALSGANR